MTLRSWRVQVRAVRAGRVGRLQWGHDLAVMESDHANVYQAMKHLLQWGHDLAVMERILKKEAIV